MRKIFVMLAAFLICPAVLAFSDVSPNHPNEKAISYLQNHGIVSGFPDGEFKPNQGVTRAELTKIMTGVRGTDPAHNEYHECFSDVWWEWYARYVCYAKQRNWIEGYSDWTFRPGNNVNRAEAAKIVLNALGVGLDDSLKFNDVRTSDWYSSFANTIRSKRLFDSTSFYASRNITRGEVAEIIFRVLVLKDLNEESFDSGLANKFDSRKNSGTILSSSIDFENSAKSSWRITPWTISNGAWTQKPRLLFNGQSFEFASTSGYIVALEKIQKHFRLLGKSRFASSFNVVISQFKNIQINPSTNSSWITSQGSSTASTSVAYSGNFTDVNLSSESEVKSRDGVSATNGSTTIYGGYENVPPTNRNPVLISFTNGSLDWVRRDYETSTDDSVSYGLIFDGDDLFAVFTSFGIEEDLNRDFRRFAKNGWLSEYGLGENKEIAVIAKINPNTGDVFSATFLSAREDSGETSSLTVTDLQMNGDNLIVFAECWYAPRRVSGQPMTLKPSAENTPYHYEIEFTPDLETAVRAEAPGFGL